MFNTGNCASVPLVANIDGNGNNNGWGAEGSWLWFIIVIFAIFGWGGFGNGFGGNGMNGGVGSEIQRGFDNQAVVSKLDGISNGLCDGFYAMNNSMLTGFNGINTNIMQTGFGIQQAINADTVANMQNTNALQSQLANCCCETREAIQGVNYNMATNTCALQNTMNNNTRDIIDSQQAGTRAILDFLTNDKIATLQAENNDLPFTMARFDNSDYVINEIPSDNQKLTYGQVIAYILQLSGLWGKCGHDGELLIGWYDMSQFDSRSYNGGTFNTKTTPYSDGDSVDGGTFNYSDGDNADGGTFAEARNYHNIYTQKDLNVATDDVVITGVKVTVTSKEDKTKDVNALAGKEGYVVSITDNPFIPADKAQTIASYIFKKIGGMRFRPLDATLLSNPLIESGDIALVTDRKQNTYSCFISNRTFTVGSGTKISCDAENASRNSADKFSNETKAIVQARKVAQTQLSAYDKQMQLLTQLMSQSLGLFKTEQTQEDGSIIYIMHNKADLNSSNIQWKMTANGMAVSNDYGKTWKAGIDKDGNAIFNIMSAIGINFDWAHGGTLTLGGENNVNGKQYVKDANGKTLVTLDNKGIALDSSVKIAWDNVADTIAKVTQITKDTVTTSYVNALDVKAGSVDAEDITGTTITGKNIVGGTIDIGNGVFVVDNDGKVNVPLYLEAV